MNFNPIGPIISFGKTLLSGFSKKHQDSIESDKKLFLEIISLLPTDGVIKFINEHDFHSAFRRNKFEELFSFIEKVEGRPGCFFHDSQIEKEFLNLRNSVRVFLQTLSRNTFPAKNTPDFQEVTREEEWMEINECPFEEAEKIRDAKVKDLNDSASTTFKIYKRFVENGVNRLKVHVPLNSFWK